MSGTAALGVAPAIKLPDTIMRAQVRPAAVTNGLPPALTTASYLSIRDGTAIAPDYDLIFKTLGIYRDSAPPSGTCLVLFFHGGLVSVESGLQTARVLYPQFVEAGAAPLFFLWHSGVSDAWRPFARDADTDCAEQLPRNSDHSLLRRHVDRRHDVAERLRTLTDHGSPETDFEELIRQYNLLASATAWGNMKQSICDGFTMTPGDPAAAHYVRLLIGAINADARPLRIILVAHSAGSIYVSRFLEHYHAAIRNATGSRAAAQSFDVVLWAPAVSFGRFNTTLQNDGPLIRNLRIFGLADTWELADELLVPTKIPIIAHIYRHSLLYIVSGAFEKTSEMPLLGMQRYWERSQYANATRFPQIAAVKQQVDTNFGGTASRIWSKTPPNAPDGFRTSAEHHGDFPGDADTVGSLEYIIRNGF